VSDLAFNFSNPRTQIMVGIMELHDHLMFFILMIFIIKIIFFIKSLQSSSINISLNSYFIKIQSILKRQEYPYFEKLEDAKSFNAAYSHDKLNSKFKNATLLEFI